MTASTAEKQAKTTVKHGPINIVKHRFGFLLFSLLMMVPGFIFIAVAMTQFGAPVRPGIDFTGGTILQYAFEKPLTQESLPEIRAVFEKRGYTGPVIQIQQPRTDLTFEKSADEKSSEALKTPPMAEKTNSSKPAKSIKSQPETTPPAVAVSPSENTQVKAKSIVSIRTRPLEGNAHTLLEGDLKAKFGSLYLVQKNSIGPTLATELLINGLMALGFAYLLIVGYLTYRFQLDYAICAMIALVHDTLTVVGLFAMLGVLAHVEVDSLFITAILTVVGFSVHDTIVVYDRIRENTRLLFSKKLPFSEIVNISVNQTLARSINTSLAALLPLIALYFFGGETTQTFVLAILIGIFIGTYSSICVASSLLSWWREQNEDGPAQVLAAA